ncbi:uncharacterized protein P884DRAFT_3919 [Thermothelomyces heterothallicus CBS 202.75]|uniref:uncharacterized protein n=1 Tax=Thermothelomyces heterothallicus CBS 202.75 TaxID=1149848 RepID=UPI0037441038
MRAPRLCKRHTLNGEYQRRHQTSSPGRDLLGSSPTSTSASTQNRSRSSAPGSGASPLTTVATESQKTPAAKRFPKEIDVTPADKAILFHIEHYVVGLPDESRAIHELQGVRRVHSHETRDVMAVAGLAGMSNLSGDESLNTLAKHHYGLALQKHGFVCPRFGQSGHNRHRASDRGDDGYVRGHSQSSE